MNTGSAAVYSDMRDDKQVYGINKVGAERVGVVGTLY
jgi:hypothetical protein